MALPTEEQETMFKEGRGIEPEYAANVHGFNEQGQHTHTEEEPEIEDGVEEEQLSDSAEPEEQAAASVEFRVTPYVAADSAHSQREAQAEPAVGAHHAAASGPHPALTADEFTGLEERVLRAVSLVRRERQARIAAEERVLAVEAQLAELRQEAVAAERLRQEIDSLRLEREQVRVRVERLLSQLDALEI